MQNKYYNTWSGKKLLEKHSLEEVNTWDIYGEDPNCDMGGYHSTPFLERVHGRLQDVIEYATQLPRFYQWGGGGDIVAHKQKNVKEIPIGYGSEIQKKQREEERIRIEQEIAELQSKLKGL